VFRQFEFVWLMIKAQETVDFVKGFCLMSISDGVYLRHPVAQYIIIQGNLTSVHNS
jgi:hypothetical protein